MSAIIIKVATLNISSPVFEHNGNIPLKYTCEGENINPPLSISEIPEQAKSLCIIVDDPDAPRGTFNHWVIWNILPKEKLSENSSPGLQGKNSFGKNGYDGPCPPSGTHRYFFKVYALDAILNIPSSSDKKTLEEAISNHILAQGELIGLYKKIN